ncbi:hypothetical protein D3C80_606580 [compost metagenome]
MLVGIAGQPEGEQLPRLRRRREGGRVHRPGRLIKQGYHLIPIGFQTAPQLGAEVADEIGVLRLEGQVHPLPDLLLGAQARLLPELEQGIAGIGPGLASQPELARFLQGLALVAGVIAGLVVHAEQIGGVRLGRVEAQELGPLLALGQVGEVAALQTVGLGGIPVLADEAGHVVVICRPGPERQLVVIQIGQQRIVVEAGADLLEALLIVGTHGVIALTIEGLLHGLRKDGCHKPWHAQRRKDDSLHGFHERHSPLRRGITTARWRW